MVFEEGATYDDAVKLTIAANKLGYYVVLDLPEIGGPAPSIEPEEPEKKKKGKTGRTPEEIERLEKKRLYQRGWLRKKKEKLKAKQTIGEYSPTPSAPKKETTKHTDPVKAKAAKMLEKADNMLVKQKKKIAEVEEQRRIYNERLSGTGTRP